MSSTGGDNYGVFLNVEKLQAENAELKEENKALRKIAKDLKEYQDHESADEIPCSIMDILCANKSTIDRQALKEIKER